MYNGILVSVLHCLVWALMRSMVVQFRSPTFHSSGRQPILASMVSRSDDLRTKVLPAFVADKGFSQYKDEESFPSWSIQRLSPQPLASDGGLMKIARNQIWTGDQWFFRPLLYRLSYPGELGLRPIQIFWRILKFICCLEEESNLHTS